MVYSPSMRLRNIRYRYPVSSQQLNDMFDDVYNDLVRLLGYESYSGSGGYEGLLESLHGSIKDYAAGVFGTGSSGALRVSAGHAASISHLAGWVFDLITHS